MKSVAFAKEADLCAAFIGTLDKGWTAYPETQGWDILLAHENGCQIGIQAKLKLNADVLNQAAETRLGFSYLDRPAPDYRAVLVPSGYSGGLSALAVYCGITVITMQAPPYSKYGFPFEPHLPFGGGYFQEEYWHEMIPVKRCPLPEYVPDVVAGASGPVQLTDWKIKALKLCVLLDATGYVTRHDFKRLNLDIRRWIENWIEPCDKGFRARGALIESFRRQHPVVWEQIVAEPEKWQRPEFALELVR